MLTISNEMMQALRDHNDITYTVEITLYGNNTVDITLTEDDLIAGGGHIERINSSDAFPLGSVYCAQLTLNLFRKNSLEEVNFFNASAVVKGVYEYGNTQFDFDLGTYILVDPTIQGEVITLVGYDQVLLADNPVSYNLRALFPMKATTAFSECCYYCGINFNPQYSYQGFPAAPSDWGDCNVMIQSLPENITYRQLMGNVALLFGANAYISPFDNQMYVVPVNTQESQVMYWGGYFDDDTPYSSGDELSGGTFEPWTSGGIITESFSDSADVINLNDPLGHPTFPILNITIGGVKSSDGKYQYGSGYLLTVDISPYTTGPQDVIDMIGAAVSGFTFRPFEVDYSSFPFADLFQRVTFEDSRARAYGSVLTHIDITLKGVTVFKCTAENPARNSAAFRSASQIAIDAVQEAREAAALANQANTEAQAASEDASDALSRVDGAIDSVGLEMVRLNTLMANSFGMFETKETDQSTGAITYYLHNKQTLASSDTVWKMTENGFAVSVDGGATWRAGIDSQGHAVVNVLSAIGIYADWIKTGIIRSTNSQSEWNLSTGVFVSTDSANTYSATISGGSLVLNYSTYDTALRIYPIRYWDSMYAKYVDEYKFSIFHHLNGMLICPYESTPSTGTVAEQVYKSHITIIDSVGIHGSVYMAPFTLTCGTVQQTSDERLKDIHPWDARYDAILDTIEPIQYNWKNGEDSSEYVGFSAQEVQKAINDLGIEDSGIVSDDGVYLSLNYNSLFALMLNKIKKQQKKIDELEERISRLEKLMEDANGSNTD